MSRTVNEDRPQTGAALRRAQRLSILLNRVAGLANRHVDAGNMRRVETLDARFISIEDALVEAQGALDDGDAGAYSRWLYQGGAS